MMHALWRLGEAIIFQRKDRVGHFGGHGGGANYKQKKNGKKSFHGKTSVRS
jgi:hypothetical protein